MEDESDPQSSGASPNGPFEAGDPNGPTLIGRTYQSNTVNGPDPVQGIAGYGASVHEALRHLSDVLIQSGVWIEVTDQNHPWRGMQFKQIE